MIALILIVALMSVILIQKPAATEVATKFPEKVSEKLDKLWDIAQISLAENKLVRAEKALLTILRVDEKNASVYNRLGLLCVKQKQYDDAIECFEIAQSLEPSATSLHNLGLIYYEVEDYKKAANAFEHAIELDGKMANRYIAYAKTQEKLGNRKAVVIALRNAIRLEPSPTTFAALANAYVDNNQPELAEELKLKIEKIRKANNVASSKKGVAKKKTKKSLQTKTKIRQ